MKQKELSELQHEWVRSAQESDLGLWWLAADVREELGPSATDEIVRRRALELLEPLLRIGALEAVDLLPGGRFVRWEGEVSSQVEKIDKAWRSIRRDPKIGEIVFLSGREGRRGSRESTDSAKARISSEVG